MIEPLPIDKKGNLITKSGRTVVLNKSEWQPDDATKARVASVRDDLRQAYQTMNRPYREFNDRSVIQVLNDDQKAFNSYVPPKSQDPDESWRAQTVRPITRNKIISIAAHVCAAIIYPEIYAENNDSDEDRFAADVMRILMEYVSDNSDYARKFVYGIIATLVNPAIILQDDFAEVMRLVREKAADGTYTAKEVVDEMMSGFQTHIIPVDEFYIANVYEHDVQKQRFVITRRFIDHADAQTIYGRFSNFRHVKPGVKNLYFDKEATFYEQYDANLRGYLDEEVIYYSRALDLKLMFVNGIMMTDCDNANPRIDKLYPFAKGGYEPIDEGRFFYFKSCVSKLGPDQDVIDTLYNMVLDGTFLSLMPPMVMYGTEEIDSSVIVPGTVTSMRETSKLEPIGIKTDLRGGMEAIQMTEKSIGESSQDDIRNGMGESGDQTAYEIAQQQQNAVANLGLFTKMIGFLVEDFGTLRVGSILQHMTVADAESLLGDETKPKFKSYLVHGKTEDGKKVSKKIVFDNTFPEDMSDDEYSRRSFELYAKEQSKGGNQMIYQVNPGEFRNLRFRTKVTADTMGPKNRSLEKALNLEAYDRMIQNPVLDQQAVTRDFLVEVYKPGEGDKYISKGQPGGMPGMGMMPGGQPGGMPGMPQPQNGAMNAGKNPGATQKGVNQNLTGQLTGSNNLSNTLLKS